MTTASIESRLVGYYKNKSTTDGVDITLADFFEGIRAGKEWQKWAEWVRQADPNEPRLKDEKTGKLLPNEYDRRKSLSACVTLGGIFNGEKKAENLREPSGVLAADLDHLDDRVEAIQFQLRQDPYVLAVFKSIGGRGLCVVFKVDSSRFLDSFQGIAEYLMTTYGLVGKQFDPSSSNINRLRYVSHDPTVEPNWKAKLFQKYLPKKPKNEPKKTGFIDTDKDIQFIIDQINARAIDITGGYQEWYKIGWSLISKYGEAARGLFQQVSQYSNSYDADECDKKFKYLVDTRPHSITISTFFYHCKQAGIEIMSPETKEVAGLAAMSKRNKESQKSALETVLKMTDHNEETARPVIEQVYASAEEFETGESLFDQLELFLRANYELRYNEITHYLEDEGIVLLDRALNNIYISAANAFDMKVSKDNVFTLLLSEKIMSYHPIKAFFHSHRDRKPTGIIDALAKTIRTDQDDEYVRFFLRKFMVGMVSTVYGIQCPLVPILTGPPNTGKTQFWRRLLPDELKPYFGETKFNKPGDDELLMTKKLLLCNDDFDNEFLSKHARFKSLTDKHTFSIRKPYGKAHEDLARLAVIAGTSNEKALISDITGNRRIVPINVLSIDHKAYNEIDKLDLIMEAFHAFIAGERPDLTSENIKMLEENTGQFIDMSIERDLIEKYFSIPTNKAEAMLWSQGEILIYLQQITGLKTLKPKTLSQEMKALGFPYANPEWYGPEKKLKRGFWLYKTYTTDDL